MAVAWFQQKEADARDGKLSFFFLAQGRVCAGIGSAWLAKPTSASSGSFSRSSELQFLWVGAERQCWEAWDVALRKRK